VCEEPPPRPKPPLAKVQFAGLRLAGCLALAQKRVALAPSDVTVGLRMPRDQQARLVGALGPARPRAGTARPPGRRDAARAAKITIGAGEAPCTCTGVWRTRRDRPTARAPTEMAGGAKGLCAAIQPGPRCFASSRSIAARRPRPISRPLEQPHADAAMVFSFSLSTSSVPVSMSRYPLPEQCLHGPNDPPSHAATAVRGDGGRFGQGGGTAAGGWVNGCSSPCSPGSAGVSRQLTGVSIARCRALFS
jgi:hypothetical protein